MNVRKNLSFQRQKLGFALETSTIFLGITEFMKETEGRYALGFFMTLS
jgi:hypothetical protein